MRPPHDGDAIRDLGDHAEISGVIKMTGGAGFHLALGQQRQHLRLAR